MTNTGDTMLRIFCICGQKMRVSQNMYGKNGKCIACRQKIRIPNADELPQDSLEVHLRDHPEFLRKAAPVKALTEPPSEAPREELALGEESTAIVPVDSLEPLRLLCSFDQEIVKQLRELEHGGNTGSTPVGAATLEGYRVLIQNIRSDLDEQLREELAQVSRRLDEIESQIAKASLNARAGDVAYADFSKIITTLRRNREFLARRRHNLRGWIATTDPGLAGGRVSVRFEDIPCERISLSLPSAPKDTLPLIDQCIEALREAMTKREEADRKLNAWKRMEEEEDALVLGTHDESIELHRASRGRARAGVAFYRQRLNQIIKDYDNDIKAVKGNLETLRTRFQDGKINKSVYQGKEMELMRTQADLGKERERVREALRADRAVDLPQARKFVVKQMAKQKRGDGLGIDCWIIWLAAALMLINIVIEIVPGQITSNMVAMRHLSLFLFSMVVVIAFIPVIPQRKIRGSLYLLVSLVYIISITACLSYTYRTPGIVGGAMRTDPFWFLALGTLLLLFNYFVLLVAAFVALVREGKKMQKALGWSIAIGLTAVAIVTTNGLGRYTAKPTLVEPETGFYQPAISGYSVIFSIENRGLRPFWYDGTPALLPRPVHLVLEEKISPNTWKAVLGTWVMHHTHWNSYRSVEAGISVAPENFVKLRITLAPGTYRYRLDDPMGRTSDFKTLVLPEVEVSNDTPSTENHSLPEVKLPTTEKISVRLRGFADPQNNTPLCFFNITRESESAEIEVTIRLGEVLAGPWTVAEYNPERRNLTLSDGNTYLIIRRGETIELNVPLDTQIPPEQPTEAEDEE